MLSKKISSVQHDIVKRARKLRESGSFRRSEETALVIGRKILTEVCDDVQIQRLYQREDLPPLSIASNETILVTQSVLQKITGQPSPDGYAAEVSLPLAPKNEGKRLLALDAVQDPSNLGAIFRAACAFGIDTVLLLPKCCDPFHPEAIQSGRGTQFRLPFTSIASLPDIPSYGASLHGTPIDSITVPEKYTLVLGNEGHGLSEDTLLKCKEVTIPIHHVESLNVAVAAGILLYELSKKTK